MFNITTNRFGLTNDTFSSVYCLVHIIYIQYETHVFSVHRCSHTHQYNVVFISFTYSTKHMYMYSHTRQYNVLFISFTFSTKHTCFLSRGVHILVRTMFCSYHLHTLQNTRIFHLKVFTYHHPFILTIHLKFPIFIIHKQPVSSTIIIQRDWL